MIRINITIALFLISILSAQALDITGVVLDDNGNPLVDVNIISDSVGTISDEDGVFRIRLLPGQSLHFSHIGYQSQSIMPESLHVVVVLKRQVLETLPITVEANRAITGVTPVAFSTLTEEEINRNYSVQDIPMVLAGEPGIYAYSESGSGTGYSYVSIRGFDQSRIAVIIDNVPLNDNESHQVYWVDHGDLLSNAKDVQIQRGIGNSLYGASAFGGSINVQTRIASEEESITMKSGFGSFGTYKFSSSYHSGLRFGPSASFTARLSQIKSDGYREFHNSLQRSAFFGLERRTRQWLHQVRINLGYENTRLVWDGVSETDLADREARRKSYQGYTDDFLQQIYSWNATWTPSSAFKFANTIYIVKGAGYYEVEKFGVDWYSYGLDVLDSYPDSVELSLTTDLLRRKWIVNQYTGWTPTMTKKLKNGRLDVGLELRLYTGDHFGEVSHFSAPALEHYFGGTWYRYYRY
ncbi:MAG: TonB-dependent receptor plug domain-containing protein, partial [Fidelibacterota bacterium]